MRALPLSVHMPEQVDVKPGEEWLARHVPRGSVVPRLPFHVCPLISGITTGSVSAVR